MFGMVRITGNMKWNSIWGVVCIALCLTGSAGLSAQSNNWPEIQQHYKKAQEALQAKDEAVAAKEFHEILRLDPKNASAHANLGLITFANRDYAESSLEFRTALKLDPSLWHAKALLGRSELRLGHRAQAQPLLEDSFKHLQDENLESQVGADLITLYYGSGNLDGVVDVLRGLQRLRPEAPDTLYTAYRIYSDLAGRNLSALAQAAPDSAQIHEVLAQALSSQDNFPGAIAEYRKALEIDPQLSGIRYELGRAILANSQDEPACLEAEEQFRLAVAADPADAYDEYMLGEVERLRSKPQEALTHYTRALQLQPDFVDAHIAVGRILTSMGRPDEALPHLLEAVRLDPRNDVAHYHLAQTYNKLGRKEDADREQEIFRKLKDLQGLGHTLDRQMREGSTLRQGISPNE